MRQVLEYTHNVLSPIPAPGKQGVFHIKIERGITQFFPKSSQPPMPYTPYTNKNWNREKNLPIPGGAKPSFRLGWE